MCTESKRIAAGLTVDAADRFREALDLLVQASAADDDFLAKYERIPLGRLPSYYLPDELYAIAKLLELEAAHA